MLSSALRPARSRHSAQPSKLVRTSAVVATGLCVTLASPVVRPAVAAPPTAATTQVAGVQRSLNALMIKIEATVEQYDSARLALVAAQRKAAAASANAARARAAYLTKRTMLSGYAASAYRSGPDGSLVAMVSSTPADYLDRLSTMNEVAHRQAEIVTAVDRAHQQYAAQTSAAQAAAAAALRVTQGIAAAKSSIEAQIAKQRGMLAGLQAEQNRLRQLAARQQAAKNAAAAATSRAQANQIASVTGAAPASRRSVSASYPAPPASGRAGAAVAAAESVLGRPYVYGAAGPGSFDCSGLTMWSWAHAGVSLPHSAAAQYGSGAHVDKSSLQPGDLLFFYSPISHVGMYIGGGRMIHAPHTGDVVRIATPMWGDFAGAVRPGRVPRARSGS
jgi:peptidoglycan DL-endopeptidase CwlO